MQITKVIFSGKPNNDFICYAEIEIDNVFCVRGLRLIRRPGKTIFVAMPSVKKIDGTYINTAFPKTANGRQLILDAVAEAWACLPKAVES